MKKESIRISIPKPCHEDWGQMSPTARGAFCQSCQREVIDFSRMSDAEIISYLSGHKKVCGNFREDQVSRKMTLYRPQQGYLNWKIYMLGLLPLMSFKCQRPHDTTRPMGEPVPTQQVVLGKITIDHTPVVPDSIITISGHVLDRQGQPVSGATVSMVDTTSFESFETTQTDSGGNYNLQINIKHHNRAKQKLEAYDQRYLGELKSISGEANQRHDFTMHRERPMLRGDVSIEHLR